MSESFSAFRAQYLRRHENPVNSALHTVGAVVAVGGLAAAVVTRRIRVVVIGDTVAFAIGAVGHLFQPGTLRDDIVADFRHPIWYVRAEGQRILCSPHLIGHGDGVIGHTLSRPAGRARSTHTEQKWE